MPQRSFTIPMNEENITKLISYLESKLSLETLAKVQRALMTAKLRTKIKERDNFICCQCGNSVHKERKAYFDAKTKIHLLNYIESGTDNNKALFVLLNKPHNRLTESGVELRLREMENAWVLKNHVESK